VPGKQHLAAAGKLTAALRHREPAAKPAGRPELRAHSHHGKRPEPRKGADRRRVGPRVPAAHANHGRARRLGGCRDRGDRRAGAPAADEHPDLAQPYRWRGHREPGRAPDYLNAGEAACQCR